MTHNDSAISRNDRVDLHDSRSVELWCAALRITTEELVQAARTVGESGERIALFIREKRLAERTHSRSRS